MMIDQNTPFICAAYGFALFSLIVFAARSYHRARQLDQRLKAHKTRERS